MTYKLSKILNELFPSDKNLKDKLQSCINTLEIKIEKLKTLVLFDNESQRLTAFYKSGFILLNDIEHVQTKLPSLNKQIASCLNSTQDVYRKITPDMLQIKQLSRRLKEAELNETISRYRSEVDAACVLNVLELALDSFLKLSFHLGFHVASSRSLTITPPPHYYNTMLDSFMREFKETLSQMELPKIRALTSSSNWDSTDCCPWNEDLVQHFCKLYCMLAEIHLPIDYAKRRYNLTLPIRMILEPFEKRFLYNFYGDRMTNKLERPEWYFTEVLTWIVLNDRWLTWIQDEHIKGTLPLTNLRVEFMRGLIGLLIDKISFDLRLLLKPPELYCVISTSHLRKSCLKIKDSNNAQQEKNEAHAPGLHLSPLANNPDLFGHLIDEILAFEIRLDDLYYPLEDLRPVEVLTRLDVLHKWICLESEVAHDRMTQLLTDENAWTVDNSSRIPQCLEDFLALVCVISKRGCQLRNPKPRAYLFNVQLSLVFGFFEAIVENLKCIADAVDGGNLTHSGAPFIKAANVLNALQLMCEAMQKWSNDRYFVYLWEDQEVRDLIVNPSPWIDETPSSIQVCRQVAVYGWRSVAARLKEALQSYPLTDPPKSSSSVCPGVFSDIFELYSRKIQSTLKNIRSNLEANLWQLSRPYFSDVSNWQRVSSSECVNAISSLSGSAINLFMELNGTLVILSSLLLPNLFIGVWQAVVRRLNHAIFDKLVMANRFTVDGAAQFQYDIENCLKSLLAIYSEHPENFIGECLESCRLLTLKPCVVELLKQTLEPIKNGADTDSSKLFLSMLMEQNIHNLTPQLTYLVLQRRLS